MKTRIPTPIARAIDRVPHGAFIAIGVLSAAVVLIVCYQLSLSCSNPDQWSYLEKAPRVVLNLVVLCAAYLVALAISRSLWGASAIFASLATVVAVVNCYTIAFHGSPFCLTELRNAGTAMTVVQGYSFLPTPRVWQVLGLFALAGFAIAAMRALERRAAYRKTWRVRAVALVLFMASAGFIWSFALSANATVPLKDSIGWKRSLTADQYGYPSFLVADALVAVDPVVAPDDYDPQAVDAYLDGIAKQAGAGPGAAADTASGSQAGDLPDIVLILNETFYDLPASTEVETIEPFLESFYNIKGASYGSAVVPDIGGGTNNTEFELLTSYSMSQLLVDAPFNYLDFTTVHDNNVSHLQSMGYRTMAFHIASANNYYRDIAYPSMGFTDMRLGWGNYPGYSSYGERPGNDENVFDAAAGELDAADGAPQFLYVLTYQNHGGWDRNPSSFDTIHVQGAYGHSSGELNEYLTSVEHSADAFADFIAGLESRERPTVVLMIGDHAPSFVKSLGPAEGSPYPTELTYRTVPLVMWSNCGIDASAFDGRCVSVTDIVPLLLQSAGIPQNAFQRVIAAIDAQYPVRTRFGTYLDSTGTYAPCSEDAGVQELQNLYGTMEYNELVHGDDYRQDWFE